MILGLSKNAWQFEKYFTDSELLPLENHKFHKVAFFNTKFGDFGGAPLVSFFMIGHSYLVYTKYDTWAFRQCPAISKIIY